MPPAEARYLQRLPDPSAFFGVWEGENDEYAAFESLALNDDGSFVHQVQTIDTVRHAVGQWEMYVVRYLGADVGVGATNCDKEIQFTGNEKLTDRVVICGSNPFSNGFQALQCRIYMKGADTIPARTARAHEERMRLAEKKRAELAAQQRRASMHAMLGESLEVPVIEVDDDADLLDVPASMRRDVDMHEQVTSPRATFARVVETIANDDALVDITMPASMRRRSRSPSRAAHNAENCDGDVVQLMEISCRSREECREALNAVNGDVEAAIHILLDQIE